jgi:hypothetical protein
MSFSPMVIIKSSSRATFIQLDCWIPVCCLCGLRVGMVQNRNHDHIKKVTCSRHDKAAEMFTSICAFLLMKLSTTLDASMLNITPPLQPNEDG